jgi:hypothetical protein
MLLMQIRFRLIKKKLIPLSLLLHVSVAELVSLHVKILQLCFLFPQKSLTLLYCHKVIPKEEQGL